MLPLGSTAVRQAVVRIRSIQSLVRRNGEARRQKEGSGEEKQMDEYLVMQRRIYKGVEEPWIIWGTTEESKVEEVLRGK